VTAGETHQAIEATFRIERARLIAGLARLVRNVDLAEDLAQDALVVALAEWPTTGVPANPGAWLMAVAKRGAIDALRRDKMRERKHEEIARTLPGYSNVTRDGAAEAIDAAMDDDLADELAMPRWMSVSRGSRPRFSIVGKNLLHRRHAEFGIPPARDVEHGVYAKISWGL
jgi:DNA-directed RNA polymerase specialized sigma24 family protein